MAVRFDAAADRLTNSSSYPQTSAGWTVTAWVRLDADQNTWATMVRTSQGGSTIATLGTTQDGTSGPAYYTALGSVEYTASELSSPATGVWVPVAWKRSADVGGVSTLTVYRKQSGVGSTQTATATMSPTDITGTPDEICIGGRGSADATEWLNGDICHVRVWSTELTQAEIEAEWASLTPVKTSGLHSNWPLYSYGDYTDTVGSKALTAQGSANPSAANGPFLGTENLCPNPAGGVDATGWVSPLNLTGGSNNQTAGTTRTTGLLAKGFPVDTGFTWTNASGYVRSAQTPVTAGQTYTVSFWGMGDETSNNTLQTCYIVWYNADGSDNSYNNFGGFNGPFGVGFAAPHRKAMTNPAPVGAVAVGIIVDGNLGCTISCLKVEDGSTAYDYADGDTAGWAWDGTTGLSSSQPATGGSTTGALDGSLGALSTGGAFTGDVASTGALAGALPALTTGGQVAGDVASSGVLAGALPALTTGGQAAGDVASSGVLAGALAALAPGGQVAGDVASTGVLAGGLAALAAPGGQVAGNVASAGVLAGALPALTTGGQLVALPPVTGSLDGGLPALAAPAGAWTTTPRPVGGLHAGQPYITGVYRAGQPVASGFYRAGTPTRVELR